MSIRLKKPAFILKISFLLVFAFIMLIILTNAGASADPKAVIKVEELEGTVGETITVPVKIKDSGGMAGGDVVLSYDSEVLELKDIQAGDVIRSAIFMPNSEYTEDSLKFLWAKAERVPMTEDGEIALISFLLKKPGETMLEVNVIELLDIDLQDIPVQGVNGKIQVLKNGVSESESSESDSAAENQQEEVTPGSEGDRDTGNVNEEAREEGAQTGQTVLSIDDAKGAVGDTLAVEVKIENPDGMAGGNIVLTYDPDIVEPTKVKSGNLLSGLIPISNLEYTENSLSVAWFGLTGFRSDGVVVEISFLLKEEGRSDLELTELSLVNVSGEDITVEGLNGSIISGEPGTSILGIAGLNDYYVYTVIGVLVLVVGLVIFLLIRRRRGRKEDLFI